MGASIRHCFTPLLSSASRLLLRQSKSTELVIKGKSHHFIGKQNSLPYTYDNSNRTIDTTPTVLNAFFILNTTK